MGLDMEAKYRAGVTWEEMLTAAGGRGDRMRQVYDALQLTGEDIAFIEAIPRDVHILAISEDWCGDCVRQVPIMARVCGGNEHLKLRIIGRDDNPDVMERYLFNGAAVVPVFVFFNENFIEVGSWSARPAACRELIARGKAGGRLAEAKAEASRLMDESNGRLSVEEFKHLIDMATESPNA